MHDEKQLKKMMKISKAHENVGFVAIFVKDDVKERDYCCVIRKYRGVTHSDCNINFSLRNKILIMFQNLRNYDAHRIMQKLGKVYFKNKCHTKWIRKTYELLSW